MRSIPPELGELYRAREAATELFSSINRSFLSLTDAMPGLVEQARASGGDVDAKVARLEAILQCSSNASRLAGEHVDKISRRIEEWLASPVYKFWNGDYEDI